MCNYGLFRHDIMTMLHTMRTSPPVYSPSKTNLLPYQNASAQLQKSMQNTAPRADPLMVPFLMPNALASKRFVLYLESRIQNLHIDMNHRSLLKTIQKGRKIILYLSHSFCSPPNAQTVRMELKACSATAPALAYAFSSLLVNADPS